MRFTWKGEALSVAMLVAMFVMAIAAWPSAPDRIPVPWDVTGAPDRLVGRFEGLVGPPLMALAFYLALLQLPRIDPLRPHYEAFVTPYTVMRTTLVGVMLGLSILVHLAMRGQAVNLAAAMPVAIGIVLLVFGNYIPKTRSNWFIGIRTPWTMTSDESWRRTHRLAGWLFAASGILVILTTLLAPPAGATTLAVSCAVSAVVSIVYSYFAWKADPARGGG